MNPKATTVSHHRSRQLRVMVGATRDQGGHRRTIFNEPKNEMHFRQVVLKLAKELLYVWIAIDDQKWVLSTARSEFCAYIRFLT